MDPSRKSNSHSNEWWLASGTAREKKSRASSHDECPITSQCTKTWYSETGLSEEGAALDSPKEKKKRRKTSRKRSTRTTDLGHLTGEVRVQKYCAAVPVLKVPVLGLVAASSWAFALLVLTLVRQEHTCLETPFHWCCSLCILSMTRCAGPFPYPPVSFN